MRLNIARLPALHRSSLLLLPLLLSGALTANADEIAVAAAPISAVTLFPDRATVTRHFEISIPAGDHTLVVSGLPQQLLTQSLRASAEARQPLRLGAVEIRRDILANRSNAEEQQLLDTLQQLQDQQALLAAQLKAVANQMTFLDGLANSPRQLSDREQPLPPAQWAQALQLIGDGSLAAGKQRVALEQQQRLLQQQIDAANSRLNQVRTGATEQRSAAILVSAAKATQAQFELSYQIYGASWTPVYDAELDSESSKMTLVQAAYVRQRTGEDWSDVALTLSTQRPSAGKAMPQFATWWIDLPQPAALSRRQAEERERKAMMAEMVMSDAAERLAAAPEPVEYIESSTIQSEFATQYAVPGKVSVPSNNDRQRLVLNQQQLPVTLSLRSAPRLDTTAYLYAELTLPEGVPLLGGSWNLTRDGSYLGEQQLGLIKPADTFELPFGADDRVEVNAELVSDETSERGLITKDGELARSYRFSFSSGHSKPLPLTVFEQLPVSRNEQIKVALDATTTPPTEQNRDDQPGALTWTVTLKKGDKAVINYGYTVRYPGKEQPSGL